MFDVCLTFVFFTLRMRFGLARVPRTIRRSAFAKHRISLALIPIQIKTLYIENTITVKLGYHELSYNKLPVITKR
jgi:hypothetical protein